jgi:uncharacterized small protein (DUF1192 family)
LLDDLLDRLQDTQRGIVENKKKTRDEIASEMTKIIVGHLEKLPVKEQEKRIAAFKQVIESGVGKNRPKVASALRTQRNSHPVEA